MGLKSGVICGRVLLKEGIEVEKLLHYKTHKGHYPGNVARYYMEFICYVSHVAPVGRVIRRSANEPALIASVPAALRAFLIA